MNKKIALVGVLALALLLTGCGLLKKGSDRPSDMGGDVIQAIGVNAYLWRSSLDSLEALPLIETDPAGGIIITDWFSDPAAPQERLKVNVLISDYRLRADALSVSVIRQELIEGVWVNAPVQAGTEKQIEDIILTRARTLWIQQIDSN